MSYNLYRKITVTDIRNEKQTPMTRTSDITGDTYKRDSYISTVAYFSNHTHATFYQLQKYIAPRQSISVAINEHHQVIAVVNHVTNQSGCVGTNAKREVKEWVTALLYIIPIFVFGAWLSYRSIPYFQAGRDEGWIPLTFGVGALTLAGYLFKSMVLAAGEGKKALRELLLTT